MTRRGKALVTFAVLACAYMFVKEASNQVPVAEWASLFGGARPIDMNGIIFFYGLVPRAAVALLVGATLGLSGALLQQLLRNPLADPSTLGISAGAQLGIVVSTLFFPEILDGHRAAVALCGAGVAAGIVFALGWRSSFEPVTMVVSGLLVGVTAAALSAAVTLARGEYLMSLITWNGGSLSQQDWSATIQLGMELIIGGLLALLMLRPLLLLGLSDASARSLGVSLRGVRLGIATVATALAGLVAAHVGLVSFVGLAAPAFVKGFGARRPSTVIALSPLAGAIFLWFCDGLVQTLSGASGETFPTGAVTALIGGPLLIWLLPKVRQNELHDQRPEVRARIRLQSGVPALVCLVALVVISAFVLGSNGLVWKLLSYDEISELAPIRWPRLLAAAGAGGSLALTGAILQRLTGNPMASPEVTGVSGGAGLGFAAALTLIPDGGPLATAACAAVGGLATMVMMLAFASFRRLPPEKLLLAGIAVGSFGSAVLAALMAVGDQRAWQILAWLGGSAASAAPNMALALLISSVVFLGVSLTLCRWLTLMPLGQQVSRTLGLPVRSSQAVILLVCGLATGAATLLVGPLSFVGLIAPHIVRRMGFATARDHLIASFAFGSVLMAFADFGARTVTFPYELPLGLFAALIGAPYLVWLVGRGR